MSNPVEYTSSLQAKSNGAFAVQLVLVYIISRLVKRLAFCEGVAQLFPSCTIAIAVGICSQLLLAVAGQEMLTMPWNDNVFMLVLLPPIVFSAGFHLKRSLFYRRMVPIVILAILGTVISLFSVATLLHFAKPYLLPSRNISYFELLAFGALISSTDPVSVLAIFERLRCDPSLGYIVMGKIHCSPFPIPSARPHIGPPTHHQPPPPPSLHQKVSPCSTTRLRLLRFAPQRSWSKIRRAM